MQHVGRQNELITKAVHKGLLSVLVVLGIRKGRCVVHDLVHDLRDSHGVSAWALVTRKGGPCLVRNVSPVVGAVQVLAIPARREDDGGTDAAWTRRAGELGCI